jgi:hypothetical protein
MEGNALVNMKTTLQENHIGRAMVSALASSAISYGLQARSAQTKDNKIGMWLGC